MNDKPVYIVPYYFNFLVQAVTNVDIEREQWDSNFLSKKIMCVKSGT